MFNEKNVSKLYRYEALLQAIDFFTQKFSIEQLSLNAFEFANEILTLNATALFLKEGDVFRLKKVRNYLIGDYAISNSPKLQSIATLYGDVLRSNFDNFFDKQDIEFFNAKLIIPLIIQDLLLGFLISDGKAMDGFDEDDYVISRTLMRLVNNSLENSKNYSDLQETNKQLDQKIFNLFSINQSSRILLSELDLSRLYALSIDVFSELTSSKVTSFGLYDDIRDCVIIRGYKNVFGSLGYYGEFRLKQRTYSSHKIVFNYERDHKELSEIFVHYEKFKELEAEYIILIVREGILGFVTISKPVNDRSYDVSLFELIESLASSTYISLRNAILFEEINKQKKQAEHKLDMLTRLNALIRTINNCLDKEELCDLTIKTLHYGFGVKKAFVALRVDSHFEIKSSTGFTPPSSCLTTESSYFEQYETDTVARFTTDYHLAYFTPEFLEAVGPSNCLVISPIFLDNLELDATQNLLGYVIVFETRESLKEEEVLLFNTITSSISPIIKHMNHIDSLKAKSLK